MPTAIRLDVHPDEEFGERGRASFASHFPSSIWTHTGAWPARTARKGSTAPTLTQGVWGVGESWVPMLNPDGNVHGLSGANSQGIDLCEEWTGTTRSNPPQSAAFQTVAVLYHVNGGSVGPSSLWRRGADWSSTS